MSRTRFEDMIDEYNESVNRDNMKKRYINAKKDRFEEDIGTIIPARELDEEADIELYKARYPKIPNKAIKALYDSYGDILYVPPTTEGYEHYIDILIKCLEQGMTPKLKEAMRYKAVTIGDVAEYIYDMAGKNPNGRYVEPYTILSYTKLAKSMKAVFDKLISDYTEERGQRAFFFRKPGATRA